MVTPKQRRQAAWEEQLRKGGLELAILLTLARQRRYGLDILRALKDSTELVVTEGTIYPILGRLTREGLLEAEWVEESSHPRKYYRLTRNGQTRLGEMIEHWNGFTGKIDRLISDVGETDEAQ